MSEEMPEDPALMREVSEMMSGIEDQVSIEKVIVIAARIAANLEGLRAVLKTSTQFSDEWIESACTRVFNTFFRAGA